MQVVILCGGKGTRIRDIASDIPKPMISIGGRPILWHIMKGYARHGFTEFILCLGHKSWIIKQYFLDYLLAQSDFSLRLNGSEGIQFHAGAETDDWTITFAETGEETMTGGRVRRIRRYIHGEHFMLTYGDGLADLDIQELVRFHLRHGKLGTVTTVRPPSRFGEIELCGDQVMEFNEKPLLTRGWISGGFFVFDNRFLDRLPARDNLVLEQESLAQLAQAGELYAYPHSGFWHAMDSGRDHELLNRLWDQGAAPWSTWRETPRKACA